MILNTFPDLLTFSQLSPFILRVVIGIIVVNLGLLKLGKEKIAWKELFETIGFLPAKLLVKILAIIEIVGGLTLVSGAFVQITAIVFAIMFFCEAILEYREPVLEKRNITFYILMFTISLSLVFLGAGTFALDLPL